MAMSPMEIRMAHLEGAYEQITARLGGIEARLGRLEDKLDESIGGVRGELTGLGSGLRGELTSLGSELRGEIRGFRSELIARMDRQFYWILSLIVVSILVPLFLRLFNM